MNEYKKKWRNKFADEQDWDTKNHFKEPFLVLRTRFNAFSMDPRINSQMAETTMYRILQMENNDLFRFAQSNRKWILINVYI